jgi:glutamyl-tRNA synthetase
MDVERKAADAAKRQFHYSRTWAATTDAGRARFEAEGRKRVVRLKMPREGRLVLRDLVRGTVEFSWSEEADHVIQRSDGSFIYHLANVVDDRDFGITHVIRAEEHLSNTPRQIFIAESLGIPLPAYAHLPYVAEPGSKRKLSKRKLDAYLKHADFAKVHQHGTAIAAAMKLATAPETFNPVVVDFYEQVGYLPEAVVNYLLLLGWSLDDKTEFIGRAQMIESFSLERVNPAPASFDPTKLLAFQAEYMRKLPLADKVAGVLPFLERAGWVTAPVSDDTRAYVGRVVEALGDRIKVFGDILLQASFFFVAGDEPVFDDKAFAKRVLAPGAVDRLAEYRGWLAEQTAFDAPSLEKGTQDLMAAKGLGLGDIVHAVRIAVTGVPVGPGLFDTVSVLGQAACLRRIDRALARARAT